MDDLEGKAKQFLFEFLGMIAEIIKMILSELIQSLKQVFNEFRKK